MKKLFADSSVCQGCHLCEIICSLVHLKDEVNPRRARIRVHEDLINKAFTPVVCKQCAKAPCVEACSYDAIHQDTRLRVPIIDAAKCNACLACLEACPFDAIFYDEQEGLPLVCDLCGGDPQCVRFCPAHPTKTHAALSYASPVECAKVKAKALDPNREKPA